MKISCFIHILANGRWMNSKLECFFYKMLHDFPSNCNFTLFAPLWIKHNRKLLYHVEKNLRKFYLIFVTSFQQDILYLHLLFFTYDLVENLLLLLLILLHLFFHLSAPELKCTYFFKKFNLSLFSS